MGVRHGQEGDCLVAVYLTPHKAEGRLVFKGTITCESGEFQLADALQEIETRFATTPGKYRISVFANDRTEPTLVEIVLTPSR